MLFVKIFSTIIGAGLAVGGAALGTAIVFCPMLAPLAVAFGGLLSTTGMIGGSSLIAFS